MEQMTMTILENMQKLQSKLEEIKPNFSIYIQNKEIPLAERWAVFALAPAELKRHEHYGPTFRSLHGDFIMYEGPVHMERGQTMNTLDLVGSIEESLNELEDGSYYGAKWKQDLLDSVDLDALKEDILAQNLKSFNYDW